MISGNVLKDEKVIGGIVLILLVSLAAVICGLSPVKASTLELPPAPPLEGVYAPNSMLSSVEKFEVDGAGPEDVAIDKDGNIYSGLADGRIIVLDPDGKNPRLFVKTEGIIAGLDFDAEGNLIAINVPNGLLHISPAGKVTVLATESEGLPLIQLNDVEAAPDGTIYFTDMTWKYGHGKWSKDMIEKEPHGRLLEYDPKTKTTRTLLKDLYMANGVAVAHDQSFVLVNETAACRTTRYWLKGPKAGRSDIFADNLPGYPDGISRGENGVFWIAIPALRSKRFENFFYSKEGSLKRKVLMKTPSSILLLSSVNLMKKCEMVLGLDQDGNVVYNLQDPEVSLAGISSVQECDGCLYLGSFYGKEIGRVKIPGRVD